MTIGKIKKGRYMLKYHAAYYRDEEGWYMVCLLDFPGVNSQGRTLKEARYYD